MTLSTTRPRATAAALATVLAVVLLAFLPSRADAHASLRATDPVDGSTVESVETVSLEFNEPIEAAPGGIRAFNGDGERVDVGSPRALGPESVEVDIDPTLQDGPVIVTYRVVSADGHPIRGAFVFSVGDDAAVDEALLARLFSGDGEALIGAVGVLVRAAGYGGTLVAGGALAYLLAVAREDRERDRARRWARTGATVGLIAAILSVPIQAMSVTGFGPIAALSPDVIGPTFASTVGTAAIVRTVALGALLVLVRRAAVPAVALGTLGLVAVLSFAIDGHTRTVDPAWLLWSADAVHLATAAVWAGGLAVLAAALRERRFDDAPVAAAGLVMRYSRLATFSVVAVTLAGSAMSWALVRQPRALFSTSYGWTLLVKLGLAAVIIGIGVVNNRRLVPAVARATHPVPAGGATDTTPATGSTKDANALPRAGWDHLRRTTRIEVALMAAIVLVTGFLVNLRPAAEAAGITGIYEVTEAVTEDLTVNMVVDPNRAGANEIHLYLLDSTGRPTSDIEGIEMRLSLPERDLGPIEREPFVAGPGHWQLNGSDLALAGEWTIDIVVRIDRFTEETLSLPVVVNPS